MNLNCIYISNVCRQTNSLIDIQRESVTEPLQRYIKKSYYFVLYSGVTNILDMFFYRYLVRHIDT